MIRYHSYELNSTSSGIQTKDLMIKVTSTKHLATLTLLQFIWRIITFFLPHIAPLQVGMVTNSHDSCLPPYQRALNLANALTASSSLYNNKTAFNILLPSGDVKEYLMIILG